VRRLALAAALSLLPACSGGGHSGGATPTGYRAVVLRVTDVSGRVHEWCVLVADTEPLRERGLMDVDSLGGYDGMLFRFTAPTTSEFYMFHTRIALSIAFFDGSGSYVSSTDMAPCAASSASACPRYRAEGPYQDALEVQSGRLPGLGVVSGSAIATGDSCQRSG
jgi:uncharacterized membrane protein (UPF0127 family)